MLDLYTILATPVVPSNDAADDRPDPTTRITESIETVETEQTVTGWLESRLSIDGPHSDAQTRDAAGALAYLVRYLNHATLPGRAETTLAYPSSVDVLAGHLGGALGGLPQLLRQLAERMELIADDGRLYADELGEPANPAVLAVEAVEWLRSAGMMLDEAATGVRRARRATSRLAYRTEEEAL